LPEILHLASAIDEAYLVPLRVALTSLKERLRPSLRPVLYLLNRSLTDSQLETINEIIETHSIVPNQAALNSLPHHSTFPAEAAFPLLLGDLLPRSLEKVLFLDPDVLVLDDVGKIWETDLAGHIVGAVIDQAIPFASSPRGLNDRHADGISDNAPYFNAGVLLIDLVRWRAQNVAAETRRYLETHHDVDFYHQAALNAVLSGKWLELDARWNLIASLTGRSYWPQNSVDTASPGIVHFSGKFKPWRFRVGGPFAETYYDALSRSGERLLARGITESTLSVYDRYFRDYLYPIEQLLWKRRLI